MEIWGYCLMPNHVHLIAVPQTADGLRRAIGEAHRRYTRRINFRERWRGYLWQGRFASFIMDEPYLLAAAQLRGVESRAGETGRGGRPVALEQCEGPPLRPRRPLGESRTAAGAGRRLARLSGQCDERAGNRGIARARSHRASAWKCFVSRPFGKQGRPCPATAERRPSVKITQNTITGIVSPTQRVKHRRHLIGIAGLGESNQRGSRYV